MKLYLGGAGDRRRAASRSASAGAGAHGRVLSLQQQAGNRAVARLIGGQGPAQLQREIGFRPGDLEVGRSWKDRLRTTFASDTYNNIVRALRDFHKAKDAQEKLFFADMLAGLCEYWLVKHGQAPTANEATQRRMIETLQAEALREAGVLRAQAIYLSDLESGGFKGAGQITRLNAVPAAKSLAAGKAPGGAGGDAQAMQLAAQYKLSAAEIAAVRTYTLPDYVYINPATANAEGWLKSNVEKAPDMHAFKKVDQKALKGEGATHAGMVMQAMAKLKPWRGTTYRGARMTPAGFAAKYYIGASVPFTAFGSSAKVQAAARKFADGVGGDTPPSRDETVSVLCVVKMTNGRDISNLSAAMVKEDEVLILPGAKFVVEDVTQHGSGNPGAAGAPATAWYTVRLAQVA